MLKMTGIALGIAWFSLVADLDLVGWRWEKFHQTRIADEGGVQIGKREISWIRKAGADCGSAGVMQRIGRSTQGKLLLRMDVRVDSYTLRGSGWGHGTGEYPVKIRIDYVDEQGRFQIWTHGFLTEENRHRHPNYTRVKQGEWTPVMFSIDLGKKVFLQSIRLYGMGWSYRGAVRNPRLTRD